MESDGSAPDAGGAGGAAAGGAPPPAEPGAPNGSPGCAFVIGFALFEGGMFAIQIGINNIAWPGWTRWAALALSAAVAVAAVVIAARTDVRRNPGLAAGAAGAAAAALIYGTCLASGLRTR